MIQAADKARRRAAAGVLPGKSVNGAFWGNWDLTFCQTLYIISFAFQRQQVGETPVNPAEGGK